MHDPDAKPSSSRINPVWVILFVVTGLIVLAQVSRTVGSPKQLIPWRPDFHAAQAEARESGRPLFVYFTAQWCGPCATLKRTLWSREEVAGALKEFVPVEVDVDQHPDLAGEYRINAMPTFLVFSADGRLLKSVEGALDQADFERWLERGRRAATQP